MKYRFRSLAGSSLLLVLGALTSCVAKEAPVEEGAFPHPNVDQNVFPVEGEGEGKTIALSFPVAGQCVNILKSNVQAYVDAMHEQANLIPSGYDDYSIHDFYVKGDGTRTYGRVFENDTDLVRIDDYYDLQGNIQRSKKVTLLYRADGFDEDSTFTVTYGLTPDLSDGNIIETNATFVTIDNLLANSTYYWQVESEGIASQIESFVTEEGFRMMTVNGISNVRDMGGRPVSGGKHIKQGVIYRGSELVEDTYVDSKSGQTHSKTLTAENKRILQDELHIGVEVDFRGIEESNFLTESALKDEDHPDISYIHIPNMSGYCDIFSMNANNWALVGEMFLAFKNAPQKPVYFHCWGGADRTGTAAFLLGGLLGMSYTDLIIDFELTSFSKNYRPHYKNDSSKIYLFPELIYALTDTRKNPTYVDGDNISTIIEKVLIAKAGLTSTDIAEIKDALLED